jgi:hypothetical protein
MKYIVYKIVINNGSKDFIFFGSTSHKSLDQVLKNYKLESNQDSNQLNKLHRYLRLYSSNSKIFPIDTVSSKIVSRIIKSFLIDNFEDKSSILNIRKPFNQKSYRKYLNFISQNESNRDRWRNLSKNGMKKHRSKFSNKTFNIDNKIINDAN